MLCSGALAVTMAMVMACAEAEVMPAGPLPEMKLMHSAFLDQDQRYLMLWTPSDDEIIFEVQVATTGYVGLGFSPNGGMRNADIIVGWVADGQVTLNDRYAAGNQMPIIDETENVKLMGGYENDTHTVLRFSRLWNTCDDKEDRIINGDTIRIIWAYSSSDAFRYHDRRGTKSIYLLEPQFVLPELGPDVKSWEILSPNLTLPGDLDTLYWCKLYKVPNLPRKAHLIGYVPVVEPRNVQHVHHIVLYECTLTDAERHYEQWLDVKGAQCHSKNMPVSWTRCRTPIVTWAVGSDGEMYPDHVGFPIGEQHGGANYYMMEMHYDNPNLRQDVVDGSGLRVFYTENIRQYEAGNLIVGSDVSPFHIIPPGQDWATIGRCTGECTQEALPPGGINVFQGLLHSHLLGRSLKLRQIRNGRELPVVFQDKAYDFNYQQARVLKDEMKIMPGDTIVTECGFDSRERKSPTFGGLGTGEEMCVAFLAYYPRANLSICSSAPTLENIYESLGIEDIYDKTKVDTLTDFSNFRPEINETTEKDKADTLRQAGFSQEMDELKFADLLKLVVASAPEEYYNTSLYDILHDEATWRDAQTVSRFRNVTEYGRHSVSCLTLSTEKHQGVASLTDYPSFIPIEPEAESCNVNTRGGGGGGGEPLNFPGGGGGGSLPQMEFMHRVVLDQDDRYVMLWTPNENDIAFEVQVATGGYVGLGFSPNGGMKGADIVLGWVDDVTGEAFLHDRYATGYTVPSIDTSQDVELMGGYQNNTHTVLRFRRPWNTCDEFEDMEISGDTLRIIWSYGNEDPESDMGLRIHSQRGTKSMFLREEQFVLPTFGPDVETWDLRSPNVMLPNNLTTLYWCKLFKMPPLTSKTHVIGYIPIIEKANLPHVHHILLYECHLPDSARIYEKWLGIEGAQCFGANMPPSWKYCSSPLVAWAIGGEGEIYPEHVGFPLGEEHGGATYFMMEIHYDNPNLRQGVVDNSGLRIFHTEKLRRYDAGILMVGHDVSPNLMVPPGQHWLTVGHCSGECTRESLPRNGVKVFSGVLHSHLLGNNITVRHIRGSDELPILLADMSYDFNFQQTRVFKDEVEISPGDSLITECGYDSTARPVPTFGGFGTQEEMCLGFFYYYPRADLALCTSGPTQENLLGTLGIRDIYKTSNGPRAAINSNNVDEEAETQLANAIKTGEVGDQLTNIDLAQLFRFVTIKEPLKYQNQSLYDVITSKDTWENKELVQQLQDVVVNGDHAFRCEKKSDARIPDSKKPRKMSYPVFTPLPPSANSCTTGGVKAPAKPLVCPPQLPSCNRYRWPNNVLGNRPFFF